MKKPIIRLYSASPRRAELLSRLQLPFAIAPAHTDEDLPQEIPSSEGVIVLAQKKLHDALEAYPGRQYRWGLAADTLVEGPEGDLGKPANRDEAFDMLQSLSGKTHCVHTALALYVPARNNQKAHILKERHSTKVRFRPLTKAMIERVLHWEEWKDVAGAYRIQGQGSVLIESIEGLWSTVVGLPLSPLYGMLERSAYPFDLA
ncbi:MAG: Maf family protein [Spirochaetales bacterium]|nr:Maf family protein [Spirochaetales bacterium]